MKHLLIFVLSMFCKLFAQNIILNSSFSETHDKKDLTRPYMLLPGHLSEVKNWYLPEYIHYSLNKIGELSIYRYNLYYSSRDTVLIPKDKKLHYNVNVNGAQLFEHNFGFVEVYSNEESPPSIIQQKWMKALGAGKYCFKFKYKYIHYSASYKRPPSLDFVVSPTDLKEYYIDEAIKVPPDLVKVSMKDSSRVSDENTPWQQHCYAINLAGNEQFLSFGTLKYKETYPWGIFYVDDIEMYKLEDQSECSCEKIEKDLRFYHSREFALNTPIINDTLTMYSPSFNIGDNIVTPDAKNMLASIIAFMQRNPKVKIKFIEFNRFSIQSRTPSRYLPYSYYMQFFGITKDRIIAETEACLDTNQNYCGPGAQYTKIGFMLYE